MLTPLVSLALSYLVPVLGVLGGRAAGAKDRPPGLQTTEVVFIGFNHAFAFLQPATSPAHIRALLDLVNPSAICVENDAGWSEAEGIPTYPHEQYAAFTWAEARNRPLYHVNWDHPEFAQQRRVTRRMASDHALDTSTRAYQSFRVNYTARARFSANLAFAEGEGAEDLGSYLPSMLARGQMTEPDTGAFKVRDDSIAARILRVIRADPGGKVAVIFGAGHYLPLKRRLERESGVHVSMPTAVFPLSAGDIARGWLADDAILLLGASLDDWRVIAHPHLRDHRRTLDLIHSLEQARPGSAAALYFRARWVMQLGDLDSAATLFRQVTHIRVGQTVPFRADARWSWPPFRSFSEKARFNLAVLHDLKGDREQAIASYRTLLNQSGDSLIVPLGKWARLDLQPFLESFLRMPYTGGLREAYRAELAMGMAR